MLSIKDELGVSPQVSLFKGQMPKTLVTDFLNSSMVSAGVSELSAVLDVASTVLAHKKKKHIIHTKQKEEQQYILVHTRSHTLGYK